MFSKPSSQLALQILPNGGIATKRQVEEHRRFRLIEGCAGKTNRAPNGSLVFWGIGQTDHSIASADIHRFAEKKRFVDETSRLGIKGSCAKSWLISCN